MGRLHKISTEDLLRERWTRGRLRYKFHDGQHRIQEAVDRAARQLFVGEIARQFGKTYYLTVKALEMACRKPKSIVKIGTAFSTDLEEFILPKFDEVLADCPEDLRPVYKSQKQKFIFPNGSEIKLVGLDRKPNGLRGNVIDLIILDEAGFMSRLDYLYKSVIIPATTHRPDCRVLIFSTPPETPAHEFLDLVQKAEYEGSYCKLTVYDNPMLTEEDIARLMYESGGEESTTWQREYLCKHVTDANLQVVAEFKDAHIAETPRSEFFRFYHLYNAMDLGVGDLTVALFAYFDFVRAKLIIEDEYFISGPTLTTKVLADALKAKEISLWGERALAQEHGVYLRVADNNNPLLLQDLSADHDMHFVPTDKGTLAEMVNTVKIMVRDGAILVHPRCKQLIGCLKYGVWDKNRRQFARSKIYGHFDALAALIYLVRNLNRVTNPIPREFNFDSSNQILLPDPRGKSELAKAFGLK